jgi:polar amino acid transport system permease protein
MAVTRLTGAAPPEHGRADDEEWAPDSAGLIRRVLGIQSYVHWALSIVLVLFGIELALSVAHNENFQWGVVGDYLFSEPVMTGLGRTLQLTALSTLFGYVLGAMLAVMMLSSAHLPSLASRVFVWFFRGTPLLVQLLFWYNLGALYQNVELGIPFGPTFFSTDSNSIITPFTASMLGLGLNAGAYFSEIVRAGILSIHHGQIEAAGALGLSKAQTLRTIIMPQAMRVIIPPGFNEIIGMLKYSSMVSVLAVPELLYSVQLIYARTFQTIPMLLVASIWYLVLTTVLSIFQYFIERHYGKGFRGRKPRERARTDDHSPEGDQDAAGGELLAEQKTGSTR